MSCKQHQAVQTLLNDISGDLELDWDTLCNGFVMAVGISKSFPEWWAWLIQPFEPNENSKQEIFNNLISKFPAEVTYIEEIV